MTDTIFPQPEASDYDEDGRLLASYLGKLDPVESFTGREVAAEENRIRAGWTVRPLESFIDETYGGDADGEPLDQVVSDLICNLLHLCDAAKLGADATLQKALRAYGGETTQARLTAPVLGPKLDLTVPLHGAPPAEHAMLVSLAEQYVDAPDRPCLDGDTTLADWVEYLGSTPVLRAYGEGPRRPAMSSTDARPYPDQETSLLPDGFIGQPTVVYAVTFDPIDEGGVGGHDWVRDPKDAEALYAQRVAEGDQHRVRMWALVVPEGDAEGITDWIDTSLEPSDPTAVPVRDSHRYEIEAGVFPGDYGRDYARVDIARPEAGELCENLTVVVTQSVTNTPALNIEIDGDLNDQAGGLRVHVNDRLVYGVCECGEIVSPQPTVGDGDDLGYGLDDDLGYGLDDDLDEEDGQ